MRIGGRLPILGVLALSLASVPGLYAQRSRLGDAGTGGRVENTAVNKVIGALEKDPKTLKNVERILPIDLTLDEASAGFKNRGQFIAALHASKNLSIPFIDLKARMTGNESMPLDRAIHALKPDLSHDQVNAETKRAEKQAKDTEQSG